MQKIRRYFISGFAVLLPVFITISLLVAIFSLFDNFLGKFIKARFLEMFGFYIPGTGMVLFLILVFVVGFFMKHFFGAKVFSFFEKLFLKIPFVKMIYPATKQIINFLFVKDWRSFKRVVLVEYPRRGIYSIGFLTNESFKEAKTKTGKKLANVFIPSSPSPLTGYIVLVPEEELIVLNIGVEESFRFIISGGVVNPEDLVEKIVHSSSSLL